MGMFLRQGPRQVRSQEMVPKPYGGLVEEIPKYLNEPNKHIAIDGVPFDARILLFRDLTDGRRHTHGIPLTKKEEAAELLGKLEIMALSAHREFRTMVEKWYGKQEPDTDSLYFPP